MTTKPMRKYINQCLNWLLPLMLVRIEPPSPEVETTLSPPIREHIAIYAGRAKQCSVASALFFAYENGMALDLADAHRQAYSSCRTVALPRR